MKILHIANIGNEKLNGVNVVVPEHILAEAKLGEDVFFYNTRSEIITELRERQLDHAVDNSLIDDLSNRIGGIDIVVFHEVNNINYIRIYKQLLSRNIPYVIVPHGEIRAEALRKKWLKKKVAYLLLFNSFVKKAEAIQCLSDAEMREIRLKTKERFVASNGVYLPNVYKESFNKDTIYMAYIGRIEVKVKGIDMLIEAIARERELFERENIALNIYGPDINGRGDEVRSLIDEFDVAKYIKLNAPIFGEEKENALMDSDLFIQTSRHEGMPAGVLEAMSYGIPCILTKGTSLGELVREHDAGYYAGDNVESIAEAIRTAVSDRANWKNKGMRARQVIENNFEWTGIAKQEISKYGEIVKKVAR